MKKYQNNAVEIILKTLNMVFNHELKKKLMWNFLYTNSYSF